MPENTAILACHSTGNTPAKPRQSAKLSSTLGRDDPRLNFTLPEFCAAARISLTTYRKLRRKGQGPQEIRLAGKILIPTRSAQDWLERLLAGAADPTTPTEG